jgi:hypothetical protein
MMLRSAEADPHVIERMQLPRRRSVAWLLALNLLSRRQHRSADRDRGRSSHRRGWSTPTVLSGPWGRPKAIRRDASRPRPRDAEWLTPPAEAGGAWARRSFHRAADFKALLHRRVRRVAPAVASGTTLVPSMGFGPLQGSFVFRSDPTVPSRRETVSAEPKFDVRGARGTSSVCGEPLRGDVQSRSLLGLPPFTVPKRGAGASPGGRSRVQPSRLFSATAGPPMARPGAHPRPKPRTNAGTVPVKSVRNPKS